MPFSHHSHSGQFCGHGDNTLEDMVKVAVSKGFHTFALTEHIPRERKDFYPGEEKEHTEESLIQLFEDYMTEAKRLKGLYSDRINLLIGFESEWIRPFSRTIIQRLLDTFAGSFDFFIGSVHHEHTHPIDFDKECYDKAREAAGGTDEKLFESYFNSQDRMLRALRPPVVGHFDLIRLKSDIPNTQFDSMKGVWEMIQHNLEYINSYGGVLELNSAALRKGLAQPYPCLSICQYFLSIGGRFTISDDSHDVSQIATNYARLLEFIKMAGIKEIYYVDRDASVKTDRRFNVGFSSISVEALEQLPFWTKDS